MEASSLLLLKVAALCNYRTRNSCPDLFGGIQELQFIFHAKYFRIQLAVVTLHKETPFSQQFCVLLCASLSNYELVFKFVAKKKGLIG